jgi:hypothetical protein
VKFALAAEVDMKEVDVKPVGIVYYPSGVFILSGNFA